MSQPVQVQDLTTGARYVLRVGQTLEVGRLDPATSPDIACKDPHVSRRHCRLTLMPGNRILVADLSTYGTFIDERQVKESGFARPGQRLRLGHQYALALLTALPSSIPTKLEPQRAGTDTVTVDMLAGGLPKAIGKYEVVAELGRGGMGVVYHGRDPDKNKSCAIKVMREGGEDDGAARFRREARLAAQLGDYPAIVRVYDWGALEGDALYLVMDYVDGPSLSDLVAKGIDLVLGVQLVARTARAVAYAHSRGVIHRDLKPDNVLVTSRNQVRLTDFGIAKEEGTSLTMTGTAMGSPNYMSPEQVEDSKRAGPESDVYGLGAILYHVLTGQPPYPGRRIGEVLRAVQRGKLTPPRELNAEVPKPINAICVKALARDPKKRHDSAERFGRQLEAWLKETQGSDSGGVKLRSPSKRTRPHPRPT